MRVGSLFAGVGGFDLGFERAGHEVVWHSEIEPHACAVLRERWPDVPNLGDVTRIDGAAIPSVDVICGGFPCQDLSVAGKRRGFEGERSVLAFEFLRIVREMREATDGRAPTFIVLENVPGLFSSSGGRDFGVLLDALGELGPLDIAWRVLDSRYFGVAQRRRRVFVVVDFGGERCDEILALREGLRRDSSTRGAAGEDVAGTLGSCTEKGGPRTTDLDGHGAYVCGALNPGAHPGGFNGQDAYSGHLVAHSLRADGFDASEDGTGRGTPLVPVAFNWQQGGHTALGLGLGLDGVPPLRVGQTLAAMIPFDTTQATSAKNYSRPQPGDPRHPLAAGAHAPAVCQVLMQNNGAGGNRQILGADEPHPTLNLRSPNAVAFRSDAGRSGEARTPSADAAGNVRLRDPGFNVYEEMAPTLDATAPHGVGVASGVRRLTPRECERLQSFPDDWTRYGRREDGSRYELADGPRYRCMGNAVTVNVAEWIGRRVMEVS